MPHDPTIGGCIGMTPYHLSRLAVNFAPLNPGSIQDRPDAKRPAGLNLFEWTS